MGGGATSSGAARRVFLGWEEPPLVCATAWLAEEIGPEMGGWLVGVPGGRAGRRLRERLTRRFASRWTPPHILTIGDLVDRLLRLPTPVAGRAVRTVAWERALRELDGPTLEPLLSSRPGDGDAPAWIRLAEEVRTLFGELAAHGLDFAHVAAAGAVAAAGQAGRWAALARAQARYEALLAEAGLADPHLARLAALERGDVEAEARVVLVGIVELNALERRALGALRARVTSLVAAPDAVADHFDALGALVPEAWTQRKIPLEEEQWAAAPTPDGQAVACLARLAGWRDAAGAGGFAITADDVSIGVPDAEVVPELERRLAEHGIVARAAEGTPVERTAPARALAAAAALVAPDAPFEALADFVRHPDVDAWIERDPRIDECPAALLDALQAEHLPAALEGDWRPRSSLGRCYAALRAAVRDLLGDLAGGARRSPGDWAEPIRALLLRLYGDRALDDRDEPTRLLRVALARTNERLCELEALPPGLAVPMPAEEAVRRLLRNLSGDAVPPPPIVPGVPTVELLGWLELPLDDAPALVVTGFDEGRVPQPPPAEAWLPEGLRRDLDIPGEAQRVARDAYWTTLLAHSRRHLAVITGRRSREGDPLVPSRLLFHTDEDRIPARVARIVGTPGAPPREPAPAEEARDRTLPRRECAEIPRCWSVTWFREYLASPYLFYLQRVLGLESVVPPARELDPAAFGTLAHDVVEILGEPELAAATDAERLAGALEARARELARQRFGSRPRAAVELQIEQLVWRLHRLAEAQAERARAGWRVAHVEWSRPEEAPCPLDVDGDPIELRGRIDRIDVHEETGRWAILDYKTGEKAADPAKDHLGRNGWKSLQLPLYVRLAEALGYGGYPELGYVALGRDAEHIRFALVEGWDASVVADAEEEARRIVRCVREGKLFDPGRAQPRDPIFAAILGQGLLVGTADDGGADE